MYMPGLFMSDVKQVSIMVKHQVSVRLFNLTSENRVLLHRHDDVKNDTNRNNQTNEWGINETHQSNNQTFQA